MTCRVQLTAPQADVVAYRAEADEVLRLALDGQWIVATRQVADSLVDAANAEDGASLYWERKNERTLARHARERRDLLTRAAHNVFLHCLKRR